jgi:hypothetical protein
MASGEAFLGFFKISDCNIERCIKCRYCIVFALEIIGGFILGIRSPLRMCSPLPIILLEQKNIDVTT